MCNSKSRQLRLWPLLTLVGCGAGGLSLAPCSAAQEAETVEFNDTFMRFQVDATRYSQGNPIDPGTYRLDIYLNSRWIGRQELRFALPNALSRTALPCIDLTLLDYLGIKSDNVSEQTLRALQGEGICAPLTDIIGTGEVVYDGGQQRIDFNVPQASLKRRARGSVDPKYWDNGITAATLKYDYTGYHSASHGSAGETYHYLSLLGGFNWQEWRLRYRSSLNHSGDNGTRYQKIATYVERAIPPLNSKLTVGESTTDGQVFDSVSYRGVALTSDDRMYADSLRGYAPVVRGVAKSNARVTINQMGRTIYETTVPPGPFAIDDLYPTGQGGDLYVTITEADGTESSFTVSYATIAELLRPGMTRYTLMAGQFRDNSMHDKPAIALGTLRHGFSNIITGYSGLTAAEGYYAAAMGLAFNTPVGALATDITQAHTRLPGKGAEQGQSIRLTYAKTVPQTNTNLTLASYHYSTRGYYSPAEAMRARDYLKYGNNAGAFYDDSAVLYDGTANYSYLRGMQHRRNRAQITITQGLPEGYGSFYASANTQNYWGTQKRDTDFQLGYNNQYKSVSYNISANRMRNTSSGNWDNQITLSFSVPLSSASSSPRLSTSYTQKRHTHSLQTGLSGSAGENNQYNYGAYVSSERADNSGRNNTLSLNATWLSPYATVGGSYTKSSDYDQYGASLSGGIVAYHDGVVLSPELGETIAVVEARNAAGARVTNYTGVHLNGSGRAVVPYLNPYRMNEVEIDPKGLSTDTELKSTSQNTAPTAGSVALMVFETTSGYSVLLDGKQTNGKPLPFGAALEEEDGNAVGYVAQGGQALIRVTHHKGQLRATWGEGPGESCRFSYQLPQTAAPEKGDYRRLEVICK